MSAGTKTTFVPTVTLTEQPDGSYVAEFDWFASVVNAYDADDRELAVDDAEAVRASEALDAPVEAVAVYARRRG